MKRNKLRIAAKFFGWLIITLVGIVLLVVVGIQIPYVQQKLIHAATSFVSDKTHTRVEIKRIAISFPKNIVIEGLFAEDLKHDTLVSVGELSVGIDMLGLVQGKIAVSELKLDNVTAIIQRTLPDSAFNFDFFIRAFASKDSKETKTPKDTTSPSVSIDVDHLSLSRIRFQYDDAVSGLKTRSEIGELDLGMEVIDLDKMEFIANTLSIAHSDIAVTIDAAAPSKPDTATGSLLPVLDISGLEVEDVKFSFHDQPNAMSFVTYIGLLEVKPKLIDLNAQRIELNELRLEQSATRIVTRDQPETGNRVTDDTTASGWKIAVNTIELKENAFNYDVENRIRASRGIDYNHLAIGHFTLDAKSVEYSKDAIRGDIRQLTVTEQCGFELQQLRTKFVYDGNHIELADLLVRTPHTRISNYASISYPSLKAMTKDPHKLGINMNFKQTRIDMRDVLLFAPDLQSEPIIRQNKTRIVSIDGKVNGYLADLHIKQLIVRSGDQTAITLAGNIKGLPEPEHLLYSFQLHSLVTTRTDLKAILPNTILPESITIPDHVKLSGKTNGSLTLNQTILSLESTSGNAEINSAVSHLDKIPEYTIQFDATNLNAGSILQQPFMGNITGHADIKGSSFDPVKMKTKVSASFSKLTLNEYPYSNIQLDASLDSGNYNTALNVNDENLQLQLNGDASVHSDYSRGGVTCVLGGANLKALHLTQESIKASGVLVAAVSRKDSNDLKGNMSIANVVVVKNDRKYKLDSLAVLTVNAKKAHSLEVRNSILRIAYQGETDFREIGAVVKKYVAQFMDKPDNRLDTNSQSFTCSVQVAPHPFLSEVLLPKLTEFEGLTLDVDYSSRQQSLTLNANAPHIQYDGQTLNGLVVDVDGNPQRLQYSASVVSFTTGSVSVPRTILEGMVKQQVIQYGIKIIDADSGYRFSIAGNVNMQEEDITKIHFDDEVILSGSKWHTGKNNQIAVAKEGIRVTDFELSNAGNSYIKANSASNEFNSPIAIVFNHFELGNFSGIIEKDSALVRGLLQGTFTIQSVNKFAFTSDLSIRDLAYNTVQIGDLAIKANNLKGNQYEMNIVLSGHDNHATISGSFQNEMLNFNVSISRLNMLTIEAFVPSMMKRSEGYLSGNIDITGPAAKPKFNGSVLFNNAAFNLTVINDRLHMHHEKIRIDEQGIYFDHFTVRDSANQPLIIDGNILTTNFTNMRFNMNITTDHFRVLNTNAAQNQVYYGTLLLSSNIKVRGTEELPDIKADVKLLEGSSFTFVVQERALSTDRGNGIVVFIDTTQNDLMKPDTQQMTSGLKGIDFNANIEVNKSTRFKIITDKSSGDNLTVSGDAILNFGIDPSGKMSLTGMYVLDEGSYKASFQKIVKREFQIKRGSTITWSGDLLDANMDVTATYKAKTSAIDLMPPGDEAQKSDFNRILVYDVNLKMEGQLLNPKLSFSLDMNEKSKNSNPLVATKIAEINNDVNELNKQVFSLLVLDRFLPTGQGAGVNAGSAATSIARNSVNQLLSDQLNKVSGKYIKGAELNFNLESSDENLEPGTQNTELQVGLKKELFDSRLSVQVGGNIDLGTTDQQNNVTTTSSQNITGDVVAEFKLTDDGSYRLKAFMENQYEGVIDGTLYKSGMGLLYTKDYNHFRELFNRKAKKEEEIKPREQSERP